MQHRISQELRRLDIRIAHILEKEGGFENVGDITGANGRLIQYLSAHEGDTIYQKDIEKAFGITRSTASRVLSLMEQKGLVMRSGVEHDARLKRVTLTERSKAFDQSMAKRCAELEDKLFRGFTKEEEEIVLDLIKRMHDNLD